MKKFLLLSIVLVLCIASNAWPLSYTGYIDNTYGMNAFYQWDGYGDGNTYVTFSWIVTQQPSLLWQYDYTFHIDAYGTQLKKLSHLLTEVSAEFTIDNIKEGTTVSGRDPDAPRIYSPEDPGHSNPGLPGDLYGIKWTGVDLPQDETPNVEISYYFTVVSDKDPIWGDFYAVNGKTPGQEVYAYNTGFGLLTNSPVGDGNAMDAEGHAWVLVPDSEGQQVPEPSTLLMLGSGLLGFALLRRKSKKG